MNLTLRDLQREAAAMGFPAETLEKVIRLVGLLNALRPTTRAGSGGSATRPPPGRGATSSST